MFASQRNHGEIVTFLSNRGVSNAKAQDASLTIFDLNEVRKLLVEQIQATLEALNVKAQDVGSNIFDSNKSPKSPFAGISEKWTIQISRQSEDLH